MDEAVLLSNGRMSVHGTAPGEATVYLQGVYWPEARLPRPAGCRWPEDQAFEPRPGEVWAELMPVLTLRIRGGPRRWRARPGSGTALTLAPGRARWRLDPERPVLRVAWRGGPWRLELVPEAMAWQGDPAEGDPMLALEGVRVRVRVAAPGKLGVKGERLSLALPGRGWLELELKPHVRGPEPLARRTPTGGPAGNATRVSWPVPALERLHRQAAYRLLGAQDPVTGAIGPGLLPETWSGHVFWDALFIVRALLELGEAAAARRGVDFFAANGQRWRRCAAAEGRPGWRWPWEMTPNGVEALGRHAHLRREVHNQAAVIQAMRELDRWRGMGAGGAHAEAILEGTRYLVSLVELTREGWARIPGIVGVDERPEGDADPATLAGIAASIRAAREVSGDRVPAPWAEVLAAVTRSAEAILEGMLAGSGPLSVAPLLCLDPYGVWDPGSARAQALVTRFVKGQGDPPLLGHGLSRDGFPWAVGMVARLRALAGDGDGAARLVASVAPWVSAAGDVPETVTTASRARSRHFATAHAALVSAMHAMLARCDGGTLVLFPAWPRGVGPVRFRHLFAGGVRVSFDPARRPPWDVSAPDGGAPPVVRLGSGLETARVP